MEIKLYKWEWDKGLRERERGKNQVISCVGTTYDECDHYT